MSASSTTAMDGRLAIARLADFPEHLDEVTGWLVEQWPDPELSQSQRRARLLDPPSCPPTLLALSDGVPAGVLGFARFRRSGDQQQSLFVDSLFVCAPQRGRGIGDALLQAALASASRFESELFVYTDLGDWYARRGWTVVETFHESNRVVLVWRSDQR